MSLDTEQLFATLDAMGEEAVRLKLAQGVFASKRKIDLVQYWLSQRETKRQSIKKPGSSRAPVSKMDAGNAWEAIQREYDVTKTGFGKKINFVGDRFKRTIIFRDVQQAYVLANSGFAKPAVILAGSVIEELLRIYLVHKDISASKNSFEGYINACEVNGLLKTAIHRLTDSVRHFRNLVHLQKEDSRRSTISKATAKGAVSSIFTIVDDL